MLDIGCWDGAILEGLPEIWNRTGIEINSAAAEQARNKGLNVIESQFENATLESEYYDIVIILDVLEHVLEPNAVLNKISNVLKKNGYIIALTGSADCFSSKIFRQNWYYCNYEEHINFFTKKSLSIALSVNGFGDCLIQSITHPTSSLYKSAIKVINRTIGNNKQKDTAMQITHNQRFKFSIVLSRIFRGKDHYLIIARKG